MKIFVIKLGKKNQKLKSVGGDNSQQETERTSSAGSCAVLGGFKSLPLTTGYS